MSDIVKLKQDDSELGKMLNYDELAQKTLSSEIYNRKLLSLLTRSMKIDAEWQHAKQQVIMEYQALIGITPPEDSEA